MNSDLIHRSEWLVQNNLKWNISKTKGLLFNKEGLVLDPGITIDNVPVSMVTEFKFLGVTLDNELNFVPHHKTFMPN